MTIDIIFTSIDRQIDFGFVDFDELTLLKMHKFIRNNFRLKIIILLYNRGNFKLICNSNVISNERK